MAEQSWPRPGYNSGAITNTEYEQLVHPQAADGMIGSPADTATVYGDGSGSTRQVKIRAEKHGLVRGMHWYSGTTEVLKAHAANTSGSTRVDTVVLRLTRATPAVTCEIRQGTPSAGAPALVNDLGTTGVYEIPLADVTVDNNATFIAAGKVARREWYLGEQTILCTSTTRPPHSASRRILETDTGKGYISDGTAWDLITEDSGVVNVALASGWVVGVGTGCKVQKRNGIVFFNIDVQRSGGALSNGVQSTICTLPSGYRPTFPLDPMARSGSNADHSAFRLEILTSGLVRLAFHGGILNSSYVSGGGYSWPAA